MLGQGINYNFGFFRHFCWSQSTTRKIDNNLVWSAISDDLKF